MNGSGIRTCTTQKTGRGTNLLPAPTLLAGSQYQSPHFLRACGLRFGFSWLGLRFVENAARGRDAPPGEVSLYVIYLIFDEGYTATSGGEWMQAGLCEEVLPLDACWCNFFSASLKVTHFWLWMEFNGSRTAARLRCG